TIETKYEEATFSKKQIARIHDEADFGTYFTDVTRKGTLPPWRLIANDLRHDDGVKLLEEIPATVIDNGDFKNVPYIAFRINSNMEVDIYGDPNDPAAISVGVYGHNSPNKELQHTCREFIASYLTTREELSALYSLNPKGGKTTTGGMTLEITPPNAPDADGAWWMSIYSMQALNRERISDKEYAKLTLPIEQVWDSKGNLQVDAWSRKEAKDAHRVSTHPHSKVYARGFYRDKDGVFRVIPIAEQEPKSAQ
ncbi:MAG: hypothetical protein ABI443_00315, partial [Chthoniobacterales bacterium]